MKKNALLAVLALAAVLFPAFGEDAGKKLRIVFCPPNMKHTWNVAAARAQVRSAEANLLSAKVSAKGAGDTRSDPTPPPKA